MERTRQLPAPQDTERLGMLLARSCPWQLPGPRLLYLSGELGSGKTTLAAAVLGALGVQEAVRSPTYALVELYRLQRSAEGGAVRASALAVHVDLYRLRAPEELEQLGLRDYLTDESLLLVEWAERAETQLPRPELWLHLEVIGTARRCRLQAHAAGGEAWLRALEAPSAGHSQRS